METFVESDFAKDPKHRGEDFGSFTLPFPKKRQFWVDGGRVVAVLFSAASPFPNEDHGTTLRLCHVPGGPQTPTNRAFGAAKMSYAYPIFCFTCGHMHYRGMYVLSDVGTKKWEFRRLTDACAGQYVDVRTWLAGVAANPAPPARRLKREREELETPPTPYWTPGEELVLRWFCEASAGLASDAVLPAATMALGREDQEGLEERIRPLLESVDRQRPFRPLRVRPSRPYNYEFDVTRRAVREHAGERVFKSRIELEHFLLLRAIAGCVIYEGATVSYVRGGRDHCYTPDFELLDVVSLTNRDTVVGAPLLIESKARYPTRDEIRKCQEVVERGHGLVLLYGYVGAPVADANPASDWRALGLRAMTFVLEHGRARIKDDCAILCLDRPLAEGGRPYLRKLLDADDRACEHPDLLRLYREIEQCSEKRSAT